MFADTESFPFRLLSDTDWSVGEAYHAKREAGHEWEFVPRRISYLVDPKRLIAKSYKVTDVMAHADEVLEDLRNLAV